MPKTLKVFSVPKLSPINKVKNFKEENFHELNKFQSLPQYQSQLFKECPSKGKDYNEYLN